MPALQSLHGLVCNYDIRTRAGLFDAVAPHARPPNAVAAWDRSRGHCNSGSHARRVSAGEITGFGCRWL